MNIKNMKLWGNVMGAASAVLLVSGIAVTSASAEVGSVGVSANASVNAEVAPVHVRAEVVSSSTIMKMSSTTHEEAMQDRQGNQVGVMQGKSGAEISARIGSLNKLLVRITGMTKLSATEKITVTSEVQNLISELTSLQTQIQVDASSTVTGHVGALSSTSPLREDVQSITKDYRVYALVMPQLSILAAADRADTIVTSMTTLSAKLQTRITAAQSAGQDVATLQTSLSDLNAKIADAQIQANAAVSVTANLAPDNGDTTIAASNAAALKSARASIQTANSDIQAAVKDARLIIKAVEGSASASVSASSSSSVQ